MRPTVPPHLKVLASAPPPGIVHLVAHDQRGSEPEQGAGIAAFGVAA